MSGTKSGVGGSLALLRRLSAQGLDFLGRRVVSVWSEAFDPAATDHERVYYHPCPRLFDGLSPVEQIVAYMALADHEVGGHLVFTDQLAWRRWIESKPAVWRAIAHALLNILEDAHIERAHLERWPATRGRLAWLNEWGYQNSPAIESSEKPAVALLMALDQAKFASYYGHQPGYKGTLPAEVEAFWPTAKAILDRVRMGATTADAVAGAEALFEEMVRRGWLAQMPSVPRVGISQHQEGNGAPKPPGTSRPQPAPPKRPDPAKAQDGDEGEEAVPQPAQSPQAHSSQAPTASAQEPEPPEEAGEAEQGGASGPQQDEPGDAAGEPDEAPGDTPDSREDDAAGEEEAEPEEGDDPACGLGDDELDDDELDEPDEAEDDEFGDDDEWPDQDEEPDDLEDKDGEPGDDLDDELDDDLEDGLGDEPDGDPGDAGDEPSDDTEDGDAGGEPEEDPADAGDEPCEEGDGEGEDAPEDAQATDAEDAAAAAARALEDARAVLEAIEREDADHARSLDDSMADARSALQGPMQLPPGGELPPDLHAQVRLDLRHAGAYLDALSEMYERVRPFGLRLAGQMEMLLQRRRSARRGLRRGRPDPARIRLEERTDRIFMQRPPVSVDYDVAVLLMVDESGSMTADDRYLKTREALMGFHVALRKLGIRHAAVGFSVDHRRPLVGHRVFMGFEHSLKPHAWWTLANGPDRRLGESGALNARDGYSLRWGARWLARQPEQRKILIFLSDGEVNHEWKPNVPPELRDRYSYEWGQGGRREGHPAGGAGCRAAGGDGDRRQHLPDLGVHGRDLPPADLLHRHPGASGRAGAYPRQGHGGRLKAQGRAGNRPALSCLHGALRLQAGARCPAHLPPRNHRRFVRFGHGSAETRLRWR